MATPRLPLCDVTVANMSRGLTEYSGESEIAQLYHSVLRDQDVFGLYVSVDALELRGIGWKSSVTNWLIGYIQCAYLVIILSQETLPWLSIYRWNIFRYCLHITAYFVRIEAKKVGDRAPTIRIECETAVKCNTNVKTHSLVNSRTDKHTYIVLVTKIDCLQDLPNNLFDLILRNPGDTAQNQIT